MYIGTKLINAEPMTRAEYNTFRGWELPSNEYGADEGYLVEYLDGGKPNTSTHAGYVSWSPKEQFEAAYRKTTGLSFGLAVEALKKGYKVARSGWNGKDMFLLYIFPYINTQYTVVEKDAIVGTLAPYLAMKTADKQLVPWLASQTDIIADDWQIIE